MTYKICVEKGPNNYSAYSPDVPGCIATGDSRAEVTRNLKSAIRFHLAEEIRQFAGDKYIVPARKDGGLVEIRAGDVHKAMNLNNRMPAVCGALGTKLFREFFDVDLISRTGPHQGANALFTFKVGASSMPVITERSRLAEEIRRFAGDKYIEPLRKKGGGIAQIRAGDVHKAMNLNNRMPAVCGALDTKSFRELYNTELVSRTGPHQGANALFIFKVRMSPMPVRTRSTEMLQGANS